MTDIEGGEQGNLWLQQAINQSAYVARNTYQDGVLQEIRLYPVDLGGAPGPDPPAVVVDRRADDTEARAGRERSSRRFRSTRSRSARRSRSRSIRWARPVGVIKIAKDAIVPVGQNLRSTFGAPRERGGAAVRPPGGEGSR